MEELLQALTFLISVLASSVLMFTMYFLLSKICAYFLKEGQDSVIKKLKRENEDLRERITTINEVARLRYEHYMKFKDLKNDKSKD